MKPYTIAGALAGVALVVALAARHATSGEAPVSAASADSASVAVLGASDVAPVRRADLVAGVPVSGTLEPAVDVRIASPVPEVVDQVLVKEGQAVRAGQVLAQFRASALAPLALSADAQRRKAAADYDRMKLLFGAGAVAQADVENAEVALRAAEAAAAQATKRLDEATVRAPVSGVISERHVEAGDRVKDGDALFRLVNTARLEFAATVPSEYAAQVRPGQTVSLSAAELGAAGVSGRVARVNATVDPATRQLKVYVALANPGGRLVGGLFASGRVVLRQVRGAVAVPLAAVRRDSADSAYVLIVEGGRLARRNVEVGAVDEVAGLVEVTAGLAGGETAVIGPAEGLRPGQRVALAEQEG